MCNLRKQEKVFQVFWWWVCGVFLSLLYIAQSPGKLLGLLSRGFDGYLKRLEYYFSSSKAL